MFRTLILALGVLSYLALGACSLVRGSSDVDTDVGEGAMGKGPGLVTGKQGGIVIYQK